MSLLIRKIKEHSFFAEILLTTSLLIIVSGVISHAFYFKAASDEIIQVYSDNLQNSSDLLEAQMVQRLRLIESSAYVIGTDRTVSTSLIRYITGKDNIQSYIEFNSEISDYLSQFYISQQDMIDSAAYVVDDTIFYNYQNILKDDIDVPAFISSIEADGFSAILPEQENPFFRSASMVIPVVFKYAYSGTDTYLILFLGSSKIATLLQDFYDAYFEGIAICRDDGSVLLNSTPFAMDPLEASEGQFAAINGKDYLIMKTSSWVDGWTVYLAKDSSETLKELRSMHNMQTLLLIFIIMLSNFLIYIIYRSFMKPLNRLVSLMVKNSRSLEYTKVSYTKENEIGTLGKYYNLMIEKIEDLIMMLRDKIEQLEDEKAFNEWAKNEKRKAEIKALQAQINPHFLYNALNSIVWTATENDDEEAASFTLRLADYYRTNLSDGREYITINEELKHAENYLWIQTRRYDRISYEIHCDDGLASTLIPKIIVQPLIENSIYHGIKPKNAEGRITIRAELRDSVIHISVADNGLGIEPSLLETIQGKLHEGIIDSSSGYGIYNVNSRIKLSYGSDYGLMIYSKEGEGTKAEITIPYSEVEE